ncbi:molybdopterin oxidoreductase family protein [Maricurvus nonylphenolicus]|uniref:molybdopterin-dependent oxidoreductase n=1 Tax=Maricurvus nonylphenolicus TaxID=1008307 RepID=UPI0036F224D3
MSYVQTGDVKKSACILCSVNCGLEVTAGGKDGRELIKIKGDRDNPSSEGYICDKASRLNYYQMGEDRIDSPMRRRADGSYEKVDWDTAIAEVAAGLKAVKEKHGGDKILFLGGGGQGNHLGGMYSQGLQKVLGVKYRSNALAQEKTGEFWVNGKMFGGPAHGGFEEAEVSVFLGKNPWHTHGFPQSRKVLREIVKDPKRSMVVFDPCKTKTAEMADYHLQVVPGGDAWALSAIIAVIIQDGLEDKAFIEKHTSGFEQIKDHFMALPVTEYSTLAGLDETLVRETAHRIAKASSVAVFEDLGVQQNINSTLVSYLQKVMFVITGNFAKKGTANMAIPLLLLTEAGKGKVGKTKGTDKNKAVPSKVSPVLGSRIIAGLLPCNEIPDEIITDHPNRFRAAIIESSNPVHSYAQSERMREAMQALEFSVVIDVAMTETAREASYVLPASSSFEKFECVFFQIDFPKNTFHIRHPVVEPLAGTLAEPEIHSRLIEALGGYSKANVTVLKTAAKLGRKVFAATFGAMLAINPKLFSVAPSLLYRTLGTTLEKGALAPTATFWPLAHQFVRKHPKSAARAGYGGSAWRAGEKLFNDLITKKSGIVFTDSGEDYADSWNRMNIPDKRIRLYLEELFPQVCSLDENLLTDSKEYPFILTAGQRRSETSNTIIRDASWDKKSKVASLYISPGDANKLSLANGDSVKITTKVGSAETYVEVTDHQPDGFVSLPNGLGLDYINETGREVRVGVAVNDLTSTNDKDFFAGTPWHKRVPAKIEKVA